MSSLRVALFSICLMLVVACGDSYSSAPTSPTSSPPPTSTPSPSPGGTSSTVIIPVGAESLGNRAFTPDDLTVAVGATVTWKNTDSVAHTSTSNAPGWSSGTVAPGGQFSFVFETTGTFPYHCAIHPGMVGTVVVR